MAISPPPASALGVPNGAAQLDGTGKLPLTQLPTAVNDALIRTLAFSFISTLPNAQPYNITVTQPGTLLANGGTPQAYVPTNPAATQHLTLNTIHGGSITNQGTISVSTAGAVTWPTFGAVSLAAGDTIQLVNQATADTAFANACLSLQYQVS